MAGSTISSGHGYTASRAPATTSGQLQSSAHYHRYHHHHQKQDPHLQGGTKLSPHLVARNTNTPSAGQEEEEEYKLFVSLDGLPALFPVSLTLPTSTTEPAAQIPSLLPPPSTNMVTPAVPALSLGVAGVAGVTGFAQKLPTTTPSWGTTENALVHTVIHIHASVVMPSANSTTLSTKTRAASSSRLPTEIFIPSHTHTSDSIITPHATSSNTAELAVDPHDATAEAVDQHASEEDAEEAHAGSDSEDSDDEEEGGAAAWKLQVGVGVSVTAFALVAISAICFFFYKWRTRKGGFRNSVASFQSAASSIVWGNGKKKAKVKEMDEAKRHSFGDVLGRPYDSGESSIRSVYAGSSSKGMAGT